MTDYYNYLGHTVSIRYDGSNTITISDKFNNLLLHTFHGVKSLSSIVICAGSAAEVMVKDFSIKRKPVYSLVSSGDIKYKSGDYWGAVVDYTKAIDKGYSNYEVFFKRANAYLSAEFYNSAIDDFTKALSYRSTEEAYFYRGVAKLSKQDPSAKDDLNQGGSLGLAMIKELNIENDTNSLEYKSSATGFFIDAKGYIVTNYHVVDGASALDVLVTRSGTTSVYKAQTVVVDKNNDLAIIRITDTAFTTLPNIPYGIAFRTVDVGASVFTMGYPQLSTLGEEIKVTNGIISSKTGYQGDITTYQISAPIQPGNSGGPLFDQDGNIVGITNAGVTSLDNVGYAIKTSYVASLIEASPDAISLSTANHLKGLSFTEKIKKISPYVVIIKVR